MPKLAWYAKRLRVMTAREVLYRARQQIAQSWMYLLYRTDRFNKSQLDDPAQYSFCAASSARLPELPIDIAGLESVAPELLAGRIPVAGRVWQWKDSIDLWHKAPDTGRTWPQRYFATIPYREDNPTGDVRITWEPSRLQQLVDLATLSRRGSPQGRHQARAMVKAQLRSWVEANPPLRGVHYISAMECALRLIAVCHALDLIRPYIQEDSPWRSLVQLVHSHASLIERRLSRFSSTGNHSTAEAAGLVYAGALFPEADGAKRWLKKGLALLEAVAREQILPDGGGAEQALSYHLFNVQLLALVHELLAHLDSDIPESIPAAIERSSKFVNTLRKNRADMLPIGDSDNGHALSRWLRLPCRSESSDEQIHLFEDSGYTVAQLARSPAIRLVFDHGPLGLPPSFGHGHADALSLMLGTEDEAILVDPGTYTYTGDSRWRRHFRGTSAHNTVTVDGRDQAIQEGCFMWSRPYNATILAVDTGRSAYNRIVAQHDGYTDLGVRHIRGVAWQLDQWLLIWDHLVGNGQHRLDLHWHLSPTPVWENQARCKFETSHVTLRMDFRGGEVRSERGQLDSLFGWRSRCYGSLEPVTTIRVSHKGKLPHTFVTLITLPGVTVSDAYRHEALTWFEKLSNDS